MINEPVKNPKISLQLKWVIKSSSKIAQTQMIPMRCRDVSPTGQNKIEFMLSLRPKCNV